MGRILSKPYRYVQAVFAICGPVRVFFEWEVINVMNISDLIASYAHMVFASATSVVLLSYCWRAVWAIDRNMLIINGMCNLYIFFTICLHATILGVGWMLPRLFAQSYPQQVWIKTESLLQQCDSSIGEYFT